MTAARTHQTVRIGRGAHRSPEEGACVVELSSMLAGEPFSDRPRCVCPVIAGFLRAINDRVPYATRQRLYPYAALAVGTRGDRSTRRARRDLCLARAGSPVARHGTLARWTALLGARLRIAALDGAAGRAAAHRGAHGPRPGRHAQRGRGGLRARRLVARGDVAGALALLEELLGDGPAPAVSGPARAPVAA